MLKNHQPCLLNQIPNNFHIKSVSHFGYLTDPVGPIVVKRGIFSVMTIYKEVAGYQDCNKTFTKPLKPHLLENFIVKSCGVALLMC